MRSLLFILGVFCKSHTSYDQCLPGSSECINNVMKMCDINGKWVFIDCPNGTSCSDDPMPGDDMDGDAKPNDNEKPTTVLEGDDEEKQPNTQEMGDEDAGNNPESESPDQNNDNIRDDMPENDEQGEQERMPKNNGENNLQKVPLKKSTPEKTKRKSFPISRGKPQMKKRTKTVTMVRSKAQPKTVTVYRNKRDFDDNQNRDQNNQTADQHRPQSNDQYKNNNFPTSSTDQIFKSIEEILKKNVIQTVISTITQKTAPNEIKLEYTAANQVSPMVSNFKGGEGDKSWEYKPTTSTDTPQKTSGSTSTSKTGSGSSPSSGSSSSPSSGSSSSPSSGSCSSPSSGSSSNSSSGSSSSPSSGTSAAPKSGSRSSCSPSSGSSSSPSSGSSSSPSSGTSAAPKSGSGSSSSPSSGSSSSPSSGSSAAPKSGSSSSPSSGSSTPAKSSTPATSPAKKDSSSQVTEEAPKSSAPATPAAKPTDKPADKPASGGDMKPAADGDKKESSSSGGGEMISEEALTKVMTGQGFAPKPQFIAAAVKQTNEKVKDKAMAAQLLAQLGHESGGFQYIEEIACAGNKCPGQYGSDQGAPGKQYYGRGFIQLSWPVNYEGASQDLFQNKSLWENPDSVAEDPNIGMQVSIWFWEKNVIGKEGVGPDHFGYTTKAINGELECKNNGNIEKSKRRYEIYKAVAAEMKLDKVADEAGCYTV